MSSPAQAPLVGRDAEVRVLDEVLDGLWAGASPALVVTGEPGIGKTRMLEELASRAGDRGTQVLAGRAAEYETDLPLAAWADALDAHLEQPLEELTETSERHRLHTGMRRLLADLAADQPLVVVLDDLHWADPASVDVAGALLRRPPAAAVLLALSFRARQAPERLAVVIASGAGAAHHHPAAGAAGARRRHRLAGGPSCPPARATCCSSRAGATRSISSTSRAAPAGVRPPRLTPPSCRAYPPPYRQRSARSCARCPGTSG